jgi:hypothetical protein
MQQSSLAAVDMPVGLLPIIDFAALLSDRTEDRKTAAQAIRSACCASSKASGQLKAGGR